MKFVFYAENSFLLLFHYFIRGINIILSFFYILGVGVNYTARSAERRDLVRHRTRDVNPRASLLCKWLLNDQSNDARLDAPSCSITTVLRDDSRKVSP